MAYLKVLLGLFSLFAKFAPLAKFAALFSWLPGGQIVGLVGGLFGLVASFFKWALADIVDAFQAPQKLIVRTICFIAVLLFGVHEGISYKGKQDAAVITAAKKETALWKFTAQKMVDDAKRLDEENKVKLKASLKAKADAEAAERAKPDAAAVAGDKPKRVRKPGTANSPNSPSGQGVFGIFGL